jgi:hypothetical protein
VAGTELKGWVTPRSGRRVLMARPVPMIRPTVSTTLIPRRSARDVVWVTSATYSRKTGIPITTATPASGVSQAMATPAESMAFVTTTRSPMTTKAVVRRMEKLGGPARDRSGATWRRPSSRRAAGAVCTLKRGCLRRR